MENVLRRAVLAALALAVVTAPGLLAGTLTVRPGVPNNGGSARYSGTHGLEVNVASPDRNPAFVQSSQPSAEGTYRVRFYVNPRNLTMTDGDEFDLFDAYDGADPTPPTVSGNAALRVVLRQTSGVLKLSAFVRLNNGSESQLATPVTLVRGWREVELNWAKSTAPGANNGRLDLWVDGVPQTSLTGLNNDTEQVNYARLGAVSGIDNGTSGTFNLDDFVSQRTGYIGVISVFADVPTSYPFWSFIQGLYAAEITGGCGGGNYCPNSNIPRDQMAIFLVRSIHGPAFVPPAPTGIFADVPTNAFAADFIEQLFNDGITGGCGLPTLSYCPSDAVTRAQMAVFLLRSKHGRNYQPPPATGTVFPDVPANSFAAAWIEQLFAEGITGGCGGGLYCPGDSVTRGQMAVFITRAFAMPVQQTGP
ncbi:MAG TPA: S-layer homology domain-containing protein [Thermoanaerobaculia bacterium]|nr:S-layer homology domain-containing protein [Thermoanaerobaculia bacterium]